MRRRFSAAVAAMMTATCLGGDLVVTRGGVEIVVDANAPAATRFAADELKTFLSRSLGGDVPIVSELSPGRACIVLGTNAWSRAAGIDVSGSPRDTFVLAETGGRLYIVGRDSDVDIARRIASGTEKDKRSLARSERATAFGVYEFLERFLGCRFYFPGELGEVVPQMERICVPAGFRLSRSPRWSQRSVSIDAGDDGSAQLLSWVRLRLETEHIQCGHGLNSFGYARRFAATHPEYFCLGADGRRFCPTKESGPKSHDVGQLCHTSAVWDEITEDALSYLRGESSERRLGRKTCWPKCCALRRVDVMPQDGMKKCLCPTCMAAYDEGTHYADTLIWSNTCKLAWRVIAEGLDGRIAQMAYRPYSRVPDMDIPTNVDVMVAIRGPWSMRDEAGYARDERKVRAWFEKLGRPVWLWTYPGKYNRMDVPDAPIVAPRAWGRYYKRIAPYIFGAFNESYCDSHAFNYLNHYVFARLAWDPSADADAIVDEHHRLMYGQGAGPMARFFDRLEALWLKGGLVENAAETAGGEPTYDPADTYDLLTAVYSRNALAELDGYLKAAFDAVPRDSVFARRIRHTAKTVFAPIRKRARDFQLAHDVPAEIGRRRAAVDLKAIGASAPWRTAGPGWRAEGEKIVWEISTNAAAEVSFKALGIAFSPNTHYRVSCFMTTDLSDLTYFQRVKRGGGVRFEVSETGDKKDWARRHAVKGVDGRRAKACYGVEFTTDDNPMQGGRIVLRANGISGSVVVEDLAIYEMSGEGTPPGKQKRKEKQP